jgi:hypothetical protein
MQKKLACCFPCVHAIVKCFHCTDKIYLAKEPINKIIDNLYLGDFRAADNPELLRSLNITHIINCAFNLPCKYKEQFTYLHLKLRDEPDQIIFPQIENAYEFIYFTDSGIVTFSRESHSEKADEPIRVMVLGIFTSVKYLLVLNAEDRISVTAYSIPWYVTVSGMFITPSYAPYAL